MQARKTVQGKIVEKKIVCRTDEQIKLVQKLVKENCSSVRGLIQENKSHAVAGSAEQPEIIEETEVNQENNGNAVQPDNGQPETVGQNAENEQQEINTINDEGNPDNSTAQERTSKSGTTTCGFKMERPKMPRFSGDVRNYVIFRADFKHAVNSRFSERDAISLLRASLSGSFGVDKRNR